MTFLPGDVVVGGIAHDPDDTALTLYILDRRMDRAPKAWYGKHAVKGTEWCLLEESIRKATFDEVNSLVEYLHAAPETPATKETVCQEADRLVSFDRQSVYGHPLDDFEKVTSAARALGIFPTTCPEHHALYMILVKMARLSTSPGHHDSIVDICGYAKTYDMIFTEREARSSGS